MKAGIDLKLSNKIQKLSREVEQFQRSRKNQKTPYPDKIRRKAQKLLKTRQIKYTHLCQAIGVSGSVMHKWRGELKGKKKKKKQKGFSQVAIVAEDSASSQRYDIEGPGGLWIRQMKAQDIAKLWQTLAGGER